MNMHVVLTWLQNLNNHLREPLVSVGCNSAGNGVGWNFSSEAVHLGFGKRQPPSPLVTVRDCTMPSTIDKKNMTAVKGQWWTCRSLFYTMFSSFQEETSALTQGGESCVETAGNDACGCWVSQDTVQSFG